MKTSNRLLALSHALLLTAPVTSCGSQPSTDPAPGGGDAGAVTAALDGGDVNGGAPDAGTVRVFCWLMADPRCLADGGVAPGVVDGCHG